MVKYLGITGWADAEERRSRGISNGRLSARSPGAASVVILALVLTVLNAIKPLRFDDHFYFGQARQIAQHPLDPYGFTTWGTMKYPWRAFDGPLPPVLPYCLAPVVGMVGPQFFWIKLALLPFALIFVFAMRGLLKRYSRGLVGPLLWITALGPVILTTLNLMVDVPAMALGLSSVALFTHAHSRRSAGLAALAGVVAGLATQTKYTGLVLPGIFLAHAATHGGWKHWLIAMVAMVGVFASYEGLVALRYGESHFLHNVFHPLHPRDPYAGPLMLAVDLVETAGGLAPAVSVIALAGLGLPYRWVARLGLLIAAGYFLLGFVPGRMHSTLIAWAFFIALGLLFIGAMVAVAGRLLVWRSPTRRGYSLAQRDDWFLVLWFALEIISYFVLSPYPAYRRFLGIVIAGTFLAGRLASRTCRSPERMGLVRGAAIGGVVLGLLLYGVDSCEAMAKKRVAQDAIRLVRSQAAPNATLWFFALGRQWLPRSGWLPLHSCRPVSSCAGDWVIQVEGGPLLVTLPEQYARQTATIEATDFIPWTACKMVPIWGPLLMRRVKGEPRAVARTYRVVEDFVVPDFPPGT